MKPKNKFMKLLGQLALTLAVTGLVAGCSPYNKVRLKSGSFSVLKQQNALNVEYEYEGLQVGQIKKKTKALPEEQYINLKVSELNTKAAGSGDAWRQEWINNRATKFHPKFVSLLNRRLEGGKAPLVCGANPNAPYTLVLKVHYIDPGWHAGVAVRPALLTSDAVLYETKNRDNPLATISLVNMAGMDAWGMAYDGSWRMGEAYAKTGKDAGQLIRKQAR